MEWCRRLAGEILTQCCVTVPDLLLDNAGRRAKTGSGVKMNASWSRSQFLGSSEGFVGTVAMAPSLPGTSADDSGFTERQIMRRRELWGLLGDLPWRHRPGPAKLVRREEHDGYTLERLVLDLNGVEPVPALLLIPHKRQPKAPGSR